MVLLSSVSEIGLTDEKAQLVSKGTALLNHSKAQITDCIERLALSSPVAELYLHRHRHKLIENFKAFQNICSFLEEHEVLEQQKTGLATNNLPHKCLADCLPGWSVLMETFKDVGKTSSRMLSGFDLNSLDQMNSLSNHDYCTQLEKCTESILLWAQTHEGAKDSVGEPIDRSILDWNKAILTNVNSSQAGAVCDQLSTLLRTLIEACEYSRHCPEDCERAEIASQMSRILKRITPAVAVMQGGLCREVVRMVCLHKSVTKLAMVTSSIFLSLVKEGFCTQETGDEEGTDGQETGSLNEVEGTGIGEGKGKDDVSKEIEDEDQVLGAQPEKKDDEEVFDSYSILIWGSESHTTY